MSFIEGVHGSLAILLICGLLFLEELGVPLPLLPGDALLIAAGILIANGTISAWAFLPTAAVAVLGGALAAYTWSHRLGSVALHKLAARFRMQRVLRRTMRWLRSASPLHIMGCRLLPGVRTYTAMVAGASQVELPTFLAGTIPAVLIWVGALTLLGAVAGAPALVSLSHAQHLALTGAALAAIGAGTLFAIWHIPGGEPDESVWVRAPHVWLVVLAAVIDFTIVASVVDGVTEILHESLGYLDPDGIVDLAVVFAAIVLFYTAVARQVLGATGGERLVGTRYVPRRSRIPD